MCALQAHAWSGCLAQDRPTLLISHHRLEGRLVSLTKPFAVLQKKKRRQGHSSNAQEGECEQRLESSPVRFVRPGAAEGFHLDGENDDDDEGPASPSMARKRARKDVLLTPHKVARADKAATIAASSSPLPRPPMRGSELDFSSPLPKPRAVPLDVGPAADGDEAGQQEWLHRQSTSTYFEVVCIIRKKILFSKRPEPVVRLDGEGGEKARLALGLARAETSLL